MDWLISTGWYAEEGFSDVVAEDIAKAIEKPIKSVRGYLGSLVKKGYLQLSVTDTDFPQPFVYAGEKLTFNEETQKYVY